jgi:hypothetical protein
MVPKILFTRAARTSCPRLSNASAASAASWAHPGNDGVVLTWAGLRREHLSLGSALQSIMSVRTLALKSKEQNTSDAYLLFGSGIAVSRVSYAVPLLLCLGHRNEWLTLMLAHPPPGVCRFATNVDLVRSLASDSLQIT